MIYIEYISSTYMNSEVCGFLRTSENFSQCSDQTLLYMLTEHTHTDVYMAGYKLKHCRQKKHKLKEILKHEMNKIQDVYSSFSRYR